MNKLNDNKNEQARYFEKKLKEYNILKEKQEKIAKRLKILEEFLKFMNEINEKKSYAEERFKYLEIGFELHHKEDSEFNIFYGTDLYRNGYSRYENTNPEYREVIKGMINGGLEVIRKYYDDINRQVLDFDFLEGVGRNEE